MRKGIWILVMSLAVGCGGGGGTGEGGETTGGEDPYAGPIGSTDVAQGQARYDAVCGSCHTSGSAPALANLGWTPARMRRQVREGSDHMPAIGESRLSAADLEAVLAYLQTIGAVAEGGQASQPAAE
jgi:mono/diheme cytochrome c family protein